MLSVRIDSEDHKTLKELSRATDLPMADLLGTAISDLKRKLILEASNNAYRALKRDKKAWAAHRAESESWETASLADADPKDRK